MSENRTRFRLDQRRAPIYEALEQFRQMRVVPFDVPGHKRGRGADPAGTVYGSHSSFLLRPWFRRNKKAQAHHTGADLRLKSVLNMQTKPPVTLGKTSAWFKKTG